MYIYVNSGYSNSSNDKGNLLMFSYKLFSSIVLVLFDSTIKSLFSVRACSFYAIFYFCLIATCYWIVKIPLFIYFKFPFLEFVFLRQFYLWASLIIFYALLCLENLDSAKIFDFSETKGVKVNVVAFWYDSSILLCIYFLD